MNVTPRSPSLTSHSSTSSASASMKSSIDSHGQHYYPSPSFQHTVAVHRRALSNQPSRREIKHTDPTSPYNGSSLIRHLSVDHLRLFFGSGRSKASPDLLMNILLTPSSPANLLSATRWRIGVGGTVRPLPPTSNMLSRP